MDLLDYNLERLKQDGKWSLDSVTAAMNASATQDVRAIRTVPLLSRLLRNSAAPGPRAQQMLNMLVAWRNRGGSRLDKDLNGKIDDPGAAIMDVAWPKIADAFMRPVIGPQLDELDSLFSRFDQPPGGQYDGWYQYFDRDIRRLLGMPVASPLANRYCGGASSRSAARRFGMRSTLREAAGRRPGPEPAHVARGRHRGADQLRARDPVHHDALHKPAERDPAGDLVQRPPLIRRS